MDEDDSIPSVDHSGVEKNVAEFEEGKQSDRSGRKKSVIRNKEVQ